MERKVARHWLAIVLAGCTLLWGLAACRPGLEDPETFSLSGTVTDVGDPELPGDPVAGVTIQFSGGFTSVPSQADGTWQKDGLAGTVTVTPACDGRTFDPPSLECAEACATVDFTSTVSLPCDYALGGQVLLATGEPMPGVTLSFSGGFSSVSTNAFGAWSKSGLTGTVTVTPSRAHWSFTPTSREFSSSSGAGDFTGTSDGQEYLLSLGISGWSTGSGSVSANPSGPYYAADAAVQVSAVADAGSLWWGWKDESCTHQYDRASTDSFWSLTMAGNKSAEATFAVPEIPGNSEDDDLDGSVDEP